MGILLQDLRYGLRSLSRNPVFALVAILTLALGIGANTALFSVVNAVLLRSLPYADSERLYQVNLVDTRTGHLSGGTSPLNFLDWRSRSTSFEYLGGYQASVPLNFSSGDIPERILGANISDTLLPALGAKPMLGRNFLPQEDRSGSNDVVILSHHLWTERFGSNPDVLGKTVTLSGRSYTIVGVMPADFGFPSSATQLWLPFAGIYEDGGRGNFFVQVIGRLKKTVTINQAQTEMAAIAAALERQYPESNTDLGTKIVSLHEQVTGKVRPTLLVLMSAVALMLLIACANVANLLLARANSRRKEIAIRNALGASRLRIVVQLLSESLVLSLAGGLLGLLFAYWTIDALVGIIPQDIPRANEIGVDARVLGFTFAIAVLTGLLFGLAPAIHASKSNLMGTIKEAGRRSLGGRSILSGSLVIAEVALSLVLLIGAGLLVRSFSRVLAVNPGFVPDKIVTFDVALPWAKYSREQSRAFFREALDRINALPGVQTAAVTTILPLSNENNSRYFTIEGRSGDSPHDYTLADHRVVSSRYFETLQIPLIRGRAFAAADFDDASMPIVIVNQAFARAFFPNQEALGRRLKMGETSNTPFPWMTVVGIVGDVKQASLEATDRPEIYRPFTQLANGENERKMTFAVRSGQPPETMAGAFRREIQSMDREQPIANAGTLDQLLQKSMARRRFSLLLLGIFAVTALILASVGIAGVISYSVAQSTRDIGIRIALGGRTGDVLKLIIGQGLALTLIGVAGGLLGSLAITRLMASLLFGVAANDLSTFAGVSVLLLFVATLACYVPARRAARVDPKIALRCE